MLCFSLLACVCVCMRACVCFLDGCSERIPEMSDYRYLAVSRSCGGSHTVTQPHQRYTTRLQHITHVLQAQAEAPRPPSPILQLVGGTYNEEIDAFLGYSAQNSEYSEY